jgi:hypothetical protein
MLGENSFGSYPKDLFGVSTFWLLAVKLFAANVKGLFV